MMPSTALLSRPVLYGGLPSTLGEVIADLQSRDVPPACVDRYVQGLLFGQPS